MGRGPYRDDAIEDPFISGSGKCAEAVWKLVAGSTKVPHQRHTSHDLDVYAFVLAEIVLLLQKDRIE